MFICFVSDIKDLDKVLTALKDSHFPDNQWDDLGLKLGFIQTELDTIGKDKQDSKDCLKECLSRWLQQDYDINQYGKPTMELLVAAVRGMSLKAVASRILEKTNGGTSQGKLDITGELNFCNGQSKQALTQQQQVAVVAV